MGYIYDKELEAMHAVKNAVERLTYKQRARVFAWVQQSLAEGPEDDPVIAAAPPAPVPVDADALPSPETMLAEQPF